MGKIISHCPRRSPSGPSAPEGARGQPPRSIDPSPQNCGDVVFFAARSLAPARPKADSTRNAARGPGVPPVQITTPCVQIPPPHVASGIKFLPSVFLPAPFTSVRAVHATSGPQNVGLPTLASPAWAPRRADPDARESQQGVSAACRSPPVDACGSHDGLPPQFFPPPC